MAKIANVALTNTFDTWRIRSNASFDRLSQFAITNSTLYANTLIANNVFKSSGNTVLGAAGKLTVINGRSRANGYFLVTNRFDASGNTNLGAAGKKTIVTGLLTANGRATVGTNLSVSGNTSLSTGASNTVVDLNGAKFRNFSEHANTAINTGTSQTVTDDTNFVRYTVSASCTITLPTNASNPGAPSAVKTVVLFFKQNGTGGYTVTLAAPSGGTIKYNNSASQPGVNTTTGKVTIYHCMKFDGDNTWYVSQSYIDA